MIHILFISIIHIMFTRNNTHNLIILLYLILLEIKPCIALASNMFHSLIRITITYHGCNCSIHVYHHIYTELFHILLFVPVQFPSNMRIQTLLGRITLELIGSKANNQLYIKVSLQTLKLKIKQDDRLLNKISSKLFL